MALNLQQKCKSLSLGRILRLWLARWVVNSSVTRQKGKSQKRGSKKAKHAKVFEHLLVPIRG